MFGYAFRDYFFSRWKGRLIHSGIHILSHLRLLVRWVFYSMLMGILVGFIGIAFVYAIQWATGFRLGHWWVIGLLPLGRSADRLALSHQP